MKSACKYTVMMSNYCKSHIFQINGVNRLFLKKCDSPFDKKSGILNLSEHNVNESLLYNFLHQLAFVLCKFGKAAES